MWDRLLKNLNILSRHHGYSKVLTTFAIILVAIILTKIIAVLLYHLEKKIVKKLNDAGIKGTAGAETRITIIRRVCETGISLFAFIAFLQQFESVRHLGTAFLASASVAGIVIGLAAQSTLSKISSQVSVSSFPSQFALMMPGYSGMNLAGWKR
jgi:small-conductance mechanosensitive channel